MKKDFIEKELKQLDDVIRYSKDAITVFKEMIDKLTAQNTTAMERIEEIEIYEKQLADVKAEYASTVKYNNDVLNKLENIFGV